MATYTGQLLTNNSTFPGVTGSSVYTGVLGTSGIDALLRDVMAPNMRSLMIEQNPILKVFPVRKGEDWSMDGRRLVFTVEVYGNGSFGVVAENGRLPEPGELRYIQGELGRRFMYMSMRLSGPIIESSKSNKGVLQNVLKLNQKSIVSGAQFHMQRQVWGNGTGVLARISDKSRYNSGTGVVEVDTNLTHYSHVRFFRQGAHVAWGTVTGGPTFTPLGYARVVDVNRRDGKITLDVAGTPKRNPGDNGSGGSEAHYFIYSDSVMGSGPYGYDVEGLDKILNTSADTYAGISGSTYSRWNGQYYDCTPGTTDIPLDVETLNTAVTRFLDETGEYPSAMIMRPALFNQYMSGLMQDVRYMPGNLNGGAKKATFSYPGAQGDIPMHVDEMAWKNEVVLLNPEYFGFSFQRDWDWIKVNDQGAVLNKLANYDAFEANYAAYGNFMTTCRNQGMRVVGLDETL
jgi:hypothetical protein